MKPKIREFPKYCIVCGATEGLHSKVVSLLADGEKPLFIVYLDAEHLQTTDEQIQEIVSDNINLANF
jgi:short-subunit dehydrogenase